MEFEMMGIDELISAIDTTETRLRRSTNKLLQESAEPLKNEISSRTNIVTGKAKADVQISRVKTSNDGLDQSIDVGYSPKTGWYMYFVEFGTYSRYMNPTGHKGVRPQHIVERSTDTTRGQVLQLQIDGLRKILSREWGSNVL